MKPTNEDRREVAENLRSMCSSGCRYADEFYELLYETVMRTWDFHVFHDVADRLADLIEPEERTCRNTAGKPFAGYRMFSCSECGAYLEVDGDTDANLFAGGERPMPRYCPNCGAKVVEE